MRSTRTRVLAALALAIGLLLGLLSGPSSASAAVAKPAAVSASAATETHVKPRPAVAQTINYYWGPAAYASFKTSAGTTVATLTISWEIADNGVCRWINRVRWAPSSFLVQTVIVGERWHTTPPQTADMETGFGWHQDNGSTNGYTSVPLTLSQMPCLDKARAADIHWSIYRDAAVATWAGYTHKI